MTSERTRAFFGVYMPLILGAIVIAIATNFLLRTGEAPAEWPATLSWDLMRAACAGGLVFVGILLFISTAGRYRKAKHARQDTSGLRKLKS